MSKQGKAKPVVPVIASAILRDIEEQSVVLDGETMSKREAQLRLDYARALNGDSRASARLQRVRDRCGLDKVDAQAGCLLVPEPLSPDEFERMAYEQQAQFRDKTQPEAGA